MAELVADCPRCGARKITFDVKQELYLFSKHRWQNWYEVFSVCRNCVRSTVFVLKQKLNADKELVHEHGILRLADSINGYMDIDGYISLKDAAPILPPDHVPNDVSSVFSEGTKCLAIGCYNAAGTMFRLCLDLVTRGMVPEEAAQEIPAKVRRNLALRLAWLFDSHLLPEALRELSSCVREDGNDGAHAGTLDRGDAENLLDFSVAILERVYTEPERVRLAKARRDARRAKTPN